MKKIILDTNCFLRWFLDDIPSQADKVETLIKDCKRGKLSIIILPIIIFELNFALEKVYQFKKTEIIQRLKTIIYEPCFEVEDKITLNSTLKIFSENNLSLVDSFLIAKSHILNAQITTFDKKLLKITH